MATGIKYNANDLQTSSIITDNIDHHGGPNKDQPLYSIAHGNRSAIPYLNWHNKTITISGQLVGTSIANMDALEDTFKSYFTGKDQNLDIDFNGGTRRYIATAQTPQIERPGGLAWANFTVVFDCTLPWGFDTASTNLLSASGRTSGSYTDSISVAGTAPYQLPIYTLTIHSCASGSSNYVTNPGFETDTSGWSSGGIGTFTRTTGQHNSGSAAGQMVNAASSPLSVPSANTYGWELYNLSGLVSGQSYTVSAWFKGNAGSEVVKFSTLASSVQTTNLTTSWQQVTFQFTATGTTDQIYIWSTTASATWFVDDVTVVDNASSTILLGNSSTGQSIVVSRTWLIGDVLVIDPTNMITPVKVNGVAVNFSGGFTEFAPGSGSVQYLDTFASRNFDISIDYTKAYT